MGKLADKSIALTLLVAAILVYFRGIAPEMGPIPGHTEESCLVQSVRLETGKTCKDNVETGRETYTAWLSAILMSIDVSREHVSFLCCSTSTKTRKHDTHKPTIRLVALIQKAANQTSSRSFLKAIPFPAGSMIRERQKRPCVFIPRGLLS